MDLAFRIRHARARAGLSQARLAEEIGVQRSAVGHWESRRGKHPSTANLIAVAATTGVRLEWLAMGRGLAMDHGAALDEIPAVAGMLIDDESEMRLLAAFRRMPVAARAAVVTLVESSNPGSRSRPRSAVSRAPATSGQAARRSPRPR